MASNEAITSGNNGDMIELIEDDIPGAKLTGAVDGYTIIIIISVMDKCS